MKMLYAAVLGALLPAPAIGSETLTGRMAVFESLLGAPWTCSAQAATYSAAYTVAPGNTLHGHLYSKDGDEDEYVGFDAQRNVYWVDDADSNGATESQTSADGKTFTGSLSDGGVTSPATNVYTISSTHQWVVRARGSAGGHPYDVTATCLRQ
jgi:hypothetical protein